MPRFFYILYLAFLNGRCSDQSKRAISRLYVILRVISQCATIRTRACAHSTPLARNNAMHSCTLVTIVFETDHTHSIRSQFYGLHIP